MPVNYALYPKNWKTEIRPRILARAEHRCEWCGVPNKAIIWRHPDTADCWHIITEDEAQAKLWYGEKYALFSSKITLTIAHLHDPNPMNCDDSNLAALCNACHLRHDAKMHAMNVIRSKNATLEKAGQTRMF